MGRWSGGIIYLEKISRSSRRFKIANYISFKVRAIEAVAGGSTIAAGGDMRRDWGVVRLYIERIQQIFDMIFRFKFVNKKVFES